MFELRSKLALRINQMRYSNAIGAPFRCHFNATERIIFHCATGEGVLLIVNIFFSHNMHTRSDLHSLYHIVQHPTSYDYDEGEWHIMQVKTTSKEIPSTNLQIDPSTSIHMLRVSVMNVETILQRNFVFYNYLISVPLIGKSYSTHSIRISLSRALMAFEFVFAWIRCYFSGAVVVLGGEIFAARTECHQFDYFDGGSSAVCWTCAK